MPVAVAPGLLLPPALMHWELGAILSAFKGNHEGVGFLATRILYGLHSIIVF